LYWYNICCGSAAIHATKMDNQCIVQ
jgi:hypothetical protein